MADPLVPVDVSSTDGAPEVLTAPLSDFDDAPTIASAPPPQEEEEDEPQHPQQQPQQQQQCAYCGKAFQRLGMLQRHMRLKCRLRPDDPALALPIPTTTTTTTSATDATDASTTGGGGSAVRGSRSSSRVVAGVALSGDVITGSLYDALLGDALAVKRKSTAISNGTGDNDDADNGAGGGDHDDDDEAGDGKRKKKKSNNNNNSGKPGKKPRKSGPRLAHHVVQSVASTAAREPRVLPERPGVARVYDEYDGRELFAPYDALRTRLPCIVCRAVHPPPPSSDVDGVPLVLEPAADAAPASTLECSVCSGKTHLACVPAWHRNDERDYRKPQRSQGETWFACVDCARCLCCGARDAGFVDESDSWRCTFRFCEACWKLQDKLTYCSVCRLFYRHNEENMVQCELCDFWIHTHCDDISPLKYDAMAHRDELYVCRLCRARPDYTKRLARTIKIKIALAATPDDDVADVQAAIDNVDRALFLPFQKVCESASEDESDSNDDDDDDTPARGRKRKNSVMRRSAMIAAAMVQSGDERSAGDDDESSDDSFEVPPPGELATGPRLAPPSASDIARSFARAVDDTSSYSEFTRRRTYLFAETTLLDAHLCCHCGGSAPDTRCGGCCEAFHWFCVSPSNARALKASPVGTSLLRLAPGEWRCMTCKLCTACGSGTHGDSLVVCDFCDEATHLGCFDPPLAAPPHGDDLWACPGCQGTIDQKRLVEQAPPPPPPPVEAVPPTGKEAESSEDMPIMAYVATATPPPPPPPRRDYGPRASEEVERMVEAVFALSAKLTPVVLRATRRLVPTVVASAASAASNGVHASEADVDNGVGVGGSGEIDDADGDGDDDDDDDDGVGRPVAQPIGAEHMPACILCRLPVRLDADAGSDALQPLLGRALPLHSGPRVCWLHARCATWVPEAELLVDGHVLNVDTALARAARLKCSHCGKSGASVGCVHGSCQRGYHVVCALLAHCSFETATHALRCPTHRRDRAELKALLDDVASEAAHKALLRVDVQSVTSGDLDAVLLTMVNKTAGVDSDHLYESVDEETDAQAAADATTRCRLAERALKALGKAVVPCESAFWRFGELAVARFGTLAHTPPPLLPPHSAACLLPLGFTSFRHFWSLRDARKPALFCFRVLAAPANTPPVPVGDLNGAWTMRAAPVRFCVDELSESAAFALTRCSTALSHGELVRLLETTKNGDALFGPTLVHDVDVAGERALELRGDDAEAGRLGTRIVGSSLDAVWACVAARTAAVRPPCGSRTYRASDFWGLTALPIVYQLERLPGAERCIYYRFRTRYVPQRLQLPSEPFRPPRPVLPVVDTSAEVDEIAALLQNQSARTAGLALVSAVRRSKGLQHSRGLRQGIDRDAPPPPPPVADPSGDANGNGALGIAGLSVAAQYRRMKERLHRIRVGPSKIAGWGAFLTEPVGPNEMLIEYVGEWIRLGLADLREIEYERNGMGCYMFRVNDEWVVDATMKGGQARFLNHSCDGNAYTRIEDVDGGANGGGGGVPRIIIYSKRAIEAGAELTYDYNYALEPDNPVACHCGAAMCRGRMN